MSAKVRAEAVQILSACACNECDATEIAREEFDASFGAQALAVDAFFFALRNRSLGNPHNRRERYAEAEALLRTGWTPDVARSDRGPR